MKLRNKLVALSLLTLLLPWSAWKLLQELERYLRQSQESALLASARLVAGSIPLEFQTELVFAPRASLRLRDLPRAPTLDGYSDDWPSPQQALVLNSADGAREVHLLAGAAAGRLYLLFEHSGPPSGRAAPSDPELVLAVRNPRGLLRYRMRPGAPGPLQLRADTGESGQAEGFWLDTGPGFRVELSLPVGGEDVDVSFLLRDGRDSATCWLDPAAAHGLPLRCSPDGPAAEPQAWPARGQWLSLVPEWRRLSAWLGLIAGDADRAWLTDADGWVMADSDSLAVDSAGAAEPPAMQTTWLQRQLYRLVAGSRTELREEWPERPLRLTERAVAEALDGREAVSWSQDLETARVRNTAAVPVTIDGRIRAAVVLQASSDGLLLVTNQALGRLLLTTLALALGLAAALWYFASRLSRRVRRLSGAVSRAMEDRIDPESLPLRTDRDELGDLARNNEKLLRAVADYSHYLQTLAGKLSHELKTPLAITRSSLDNLASQALDAESRRFLERAQEGVDRQAAIVRAMSEASRLEAAIGAADWERVDLRELVSSCVAGYRTLHPDRRIALQLPDTEAPLHCAPDLLAQALDKLVDNALSLTGPGDEVAVSLRREPDRYALAVSNTGSALPADFQDRLFDSLVSVRSKRGAEPHLGLGLYIVRLVVTAHRGEVSARNLPDGAGVEFLIRLPRA